MLFNELKIIIIFIKNLLFFFEIYRNINNESIENSLPSTETTTEQNIAPMTLLAVHVYSPASNSETLSTSKKLQPSFSYTFKRMSSSLTGLPSLNQEICGLGIPCTLANIFNELPSWMRSSTGFVMNCGGR